MVVISSRNPNGFNEEPIKGIDGQRVRYLVLQTLGRSETPLRVSPYAIMEIYQDTHGRYVASVVTSRQDKYLDYTAIKTSEFREVLKFLVPHGTTAEEALRQAKQIPSVSRAATIADMAVSGAGR